VPNLTTVTKVVIPAVLWNIFISVSKSLRHRFFTSY